MLKIIFSEHARYQMVERNISESEIIFAVQYPDKMISQLDEKFQVIKLIKKNNKKFALVVIYRETNSAKKVITAFLTTKVKKYLIDE